MFGKIEVYQTKQQLIRGTAEAFKQTVNRAVAQKDVCTIALAGGTTPRDVYELLASNPFKNSIEWRKIHFFWSDERTVPPHHPDSNYGMVYQSLLEKIPVPANNIHRMRGEVDPQQAAAEYEKTLQTVFRKNTIQFDLVLLGLGQDGHTASIFPNTDAMDESAKKAIAVYVPGLQTWRISLTLPAINAARKIVFLVSGSKKAKIFNKVRHTLTPDKNVPATLVQPTQGELTWMVDAAAAAIS